MASAEESLEWYPPCKALDQHYIFIIPQPQRVCKHAGAVCFEPYRGKILGFWLRQDAPARPPVLQHEIGNLLREKPLCHMLPQPADKRQFFPP